MKNNETDLSEIISKIEERVRNLEKKLIQNLALSSEKEPIHENKSCSIYDKILKEVKEQPNSKGENLHESER